MGKWVEVEDIERPAAAVAAEILQERVKVVHQLLPLAAHKYEDDVEYVHQLRVGCRRSGAALQSFRTLLQGKAKRLRKVLRDIRRAAGPARDADVLLMRLEAESEGRVCHDYIVSRLRRRRAKVQLALVEVSRDEHYDKLRKHLKHVVKQLKHQAKAGRGATFANYACEALENVGQEMFKRANVRDPTVGQLHQLRVAGKRLRYSIELFYTAFPSALREDVYPLIEEIQSKLGRLNDHATAQAMYQHWLANMPPDEQAARLAQRIIEEHEAIEEVRGEFLEWWTSKRVTRLESDLSKILVSPQSKPNRPRRVS